MMSKRQSVFSLLIAVLIYITPGLVYAIVSASRSSLSPAPSLFVFLFYLLAFLPSGPYLFSVFLYPFGLILGMLYYATTYGLLYRYMKMHITSVEGTKFRFGKGWSLFLGCVVISLCSWGGSFVFFIFYAPYIILLIIPALVFISFGILMRKRISLSYYCLSIAVFVIWYLLEIIPALLAIGQAP